MSQKIQRVPKGLADALSLAGSFAPASLMDEVRGTLELLQFFGQQQRSRFSNSGTPAEAVPVVLSVPNNQWWVLFAAATGATKTATMTALRVALFVNTIVVNSVEGGPFGATETGVVHCSFVPGYPLLLAPGGSILGSCPIIGTDATATVTIQCEVGVLG